MANPVKGEIQLTLKDGREFILVADIEATIEAEVLYGKPAMEIAEDAKRGFIGAIRALFYGMLKRNHPNITAGETSALLMENMDEIERAMSAANMAASTPVEGKQGSRPQDPRPGKNSGRNGAVRNSTRKTSGSKPLEHTT